MNNSAPSPETTPPPKLRVERKHGGHNVEEISTVVPVNDPSCKHVSWTLDPTETDFIAYVCDNPNCGIVKLYDK